MRKTAFLLVALLALPLFAADYGTVVIHDGKHHFMNGDSGHDLDTSALGTHFAAFERDGVQYVIRDAATLARLRKVLQPQVALGAQQAKLGSQQAAIGARQAALGSKQAALGTKQATARSSERQRELAEGQRELAEQQRELADEQRPLAEQQRILGEKQRQAGRESKRQLEKIFEEAIRSGVAKRR